MKEPNERQEAVLAHQHLPVWQIAEQLNESANYIRNVFSRHNIKATTDRQHHINLLVASGKEAANRKNLDAQPPKIRFFLPPELLENARRMVGNGDSVEHVAELYQMTPERLRRFINHYR